MKNKYNSYGAYKNHIKRPLDCVLSSCALIVLSPIIGVVALLVRVKLGSPVIFKQPRPGKDEKAFNMYKFRTMTEAKDENGVLLPDLKRLTKLGKFLRNSSLDELPEIFNVFKGDMSIVGPRPLLVKYLPLYNKKQHRRHEVRPGITGYAQAHGRNFMSWEEKFDLDVEYVDNITFLGDMKIIIDTFFSVLKHEGIDSSGTNTVTVDEFKGTQEVQ